MQFYIRILLLAFTIANVITMEINITKLERENMLSTSTKRSKKKGDENQKEQMGYELVPLENIDTTTEPISETNIQMVKDVDPADCMICLEPFTILNNAFKIEITNEEFKQMHATHASVFHKPCIMAWMKDANTCPICRQILQEPLSIRLKKALKNVYESTLRIVKTFLLNPFLWFIIYISLNDIYFKYCPLRYANTTYCVNLAYIASMTFFIMMYRIIVSCYQNQREEVH